MGCAAGDDAVGVVDWDGRTSAHGAVKAATHERGVGETSFRGDLIFFLFRQATHAVVSEARHLAFRTS